MTYELTTGLKWSWICLNKGCRNAVLMSENTIHQAIGVYTHWVILGMELNGIRIGMPFNTTYSYIYISSKVTVPGTTKLTN